MRQKSLSSLGFDRHHKQARRERFLAEMDMVVPWTALSALIEPHYLSGGRGRWPARPVSPTCNASRPTRSAQTPHAEAGGA